MRCPCQDSNNIYDPHRDALAEGFAPTKEAALEAIGKAVAELGVEANQGFSYYATSYKKHWRDRAKSKAEPETSTFQGSPHIWRNGSYFDDQDGKYVSYWKTHQVIKVTNKCVFVYQEDSDSNARLDRAALEQNGAVSVGYYHYYTEAGRQAAIAEEGEKERRRQEQQATQRERRAKRDEETRLSLIGKECIFCGDTPDRYTEDKAPACSPCHKKAQGYYIVPRGVYLPFRTIDA
jgi:hypothetical protein